MKQTFLLLACLSASTIQAQAPAQIQGKDIPVERMRQSYSHTASTADDAIWAHSYSDTQHGRARVIVLYLVAANPRDRRSRSGREWELPYDGFVLNAMSLGNRSPDGEGAITLEVTTPTGTDEICTLLYGFTEEGKLRSALTDTECVNASTN